jgi:hypothetical protein
MPSPPHFLWIWRGGGSPPGCRGPTTRPAAACPQPPRARAWKVVVPELLRRRRCFASLGDEPQQGAPRSEARRQGVPGRGAARPAGKEYQGRDLRGRRRGRGACSPRGSAMAVVYPPRPEIRRRGARRRGPPARRFLSLRARGWGCRHSRTSCPQSALARSTRCRQGGATGRELPPSLASTTPSTAAGSTDAHPEAVGVPSGPAPRSPSSLAPARGPRDGRTPAHGSCEEGGHRLGCASSIAELSWTPARAQGRAAEEQRMGAAEEQRNGEGWRERKER